MSGMTMGEKILARASGQARVRPGDVVFPKPELVIMHDGYIETAHKALTGMGYRRISNPDRVMFVTDHDVIYTDARRIERARANRRIAAEWRVGQFYDAGRGGHGHLFPLEDGIVRPGMFLFAYDPHCTTFGATGAYAQGVITEIVAVLATGTLFTDVAPTLRIMLTGQMPTGTHARDLGFRLSHELSSGAFGVPYDRRLVEFAGPATDAMSIPGRVALVNTLTEIGVGHVLFPPPSLEGAAVVSDPDAIFENTIHFDLSTLTPQLALPGRPDNAAEIAAAQGQRIDHAYLGSCGSGMYEDFAVAAAAMQGRRVADWVRLFVVPGTVRTARRMAADGLTDKFLEAGAIMLPPGCGPCTGGRTGPLGPGEVSISTAATNNAGRMGDPTSLAYLASPITVGASAVAGCITDPRRCLS